MDRSLTKHLDWMQASAVQLEVVYFIVDMAINGVDDVGWYV